MMRRWSVVWLFSSSIRALVIMRQEHKGSCCRGRVWTSVAREEAISIPGDGQRGKSYSTAERQTQ
jgi:hypothetical protein